MRPLLLCLLPWMVSSAVMGTEAVNAPLSESVDTVNAAYTAGVGGSQEVIRDGDTCWVPIETVESWGWRVRALEDEVDLDAEGRRVRVPWRIAAGRRLVDLNSAATQLGATAYWDGPVFRFLGQVRTLEFSESSVRVGATLSFRVQTTLLQNPRRLVLDLVGVSLPEDAKFRLPHNVRVGQFRPDIVRLVVEDPDVQLPRTTRPLSSRFLDLSLAPFRFPDDQLVEPPFNITPPDLEHLGGAQSPAPGTIIGAPTSRITGGNVRSLDARRDQIDFALSAPLAQQPTIRREGVTTLVLTVKASLANPTLFEDLTGRFVRDVTAAPLPNGDTLLTIQTSQPVVYELAAAGGTIGLRLIRPRSADGRIEGKTIVIDPGHGGVDSGAVWRDSGLMEKTIVLNVSRHVAEILTDRGANVIMTRNSDVRIPLTERSAIANRNQAQAFVSVHVNSSAGVNRKSGGMTFFHRREAEGMLLAKCIQDELAKVTGIPSHGAWSDTRIYQSGFAVLRNSNMSAVLIELGFINHSTDRPLMARPEWQRRAAEAIARGIKVYFGDVKAAQP